MHHLSINLVFRLSLALSLLQVALQFCLSEHRMHGHPIGSLNVEQLEQNVRAAITPIDDSILDEIQQVGL